MPRIIAVIGADGFVGKAICGEVEKRKKIHLIKIRRGDDIGTLTKNADVIIHAANPSKRFLAENKPELDFKESVEKTYEIKKIVKNKKLVLISTISARSQLYAVYGRHRRACEMLVDTPNNLVVRLGPMFGDYKHVGPLHDILNNNTVYVDKETRYAYVSVLYNARKIIDSLEAVGLMELGAKNYVTLAYLKEVLGSSSNFSGPKDDQIPINPPSDAPDAHDVVIFALGLKNKSVRSSSTE